MNMLKWFRLMNNKKLLRQNNRPVLTIKGFTKTHYILSKGTKSKVTDKL